MKVISCEGCGVLLDADRIKFPPVWDDNGEWIKGNSVWNGANYISVAACPVCKHNVEEP